MWIYCFFDLPTETAQERKTAARFRKALLQDGFTMFQYSIYIRHCPSAQHAEKHVRRIQGGLPEKGNVVLLQLTDKQFGSMIVHHGKVKKDPPKTRYEQVALF